MVIGGTHALWKDSPLQVSEHGHHFTCSPWFSFWFLCVLVFLFLFWWEHLNSNLLAKVRFSASAKSQQSERPKGSWELGRGRRICCQASARGWQFLLSFCLVFWPHAVSLALIHKWQLSPQADFHHTVLWQSHRKAHYTPYLVFSATILWGIVEEIFSFHYSDEKPRLKFTQL